MKRNFKIIEYSVLLLGIIAFAILFVIFRFDRAKLIMLFAGAAIFYPIWGALHHLYEKRLSVEIALEYVLMAFFIFLLALTALSV